MLLTSAIFQGSFRIVTGASICEHGTHCPLAFLALFFCFAQLKPIPVVRPVVVLWCFHLFIGISGGFWGLGTSNSPFVLFGPENALFKLPKHYVLKENGQFWSENTIKLEKNAKRTTGFIFTHVQTLRPPNNGRCLPPKDKVSHQ